jgi:uncharacterized RDD family membrane protein YckC
VWLTAAVDVGRYCRRCGEALAPDAVFCAACGTAVAYTPTATAEPTAGQEGVAATAPVASYGQRVGAWIIDCVIVYGFVLVVAVIVVAIYFPDASDTQSGQTGLGLVIGSLVPLYSAILHRVWHGQTVGKRCLWIAVRRIDGTEIGLGRSFARSYARAVGWLFFPVWVLDSLWPLWQRERRTLHDLIAETLVIARPRDDV